MNYKEMIRNVMKDDETCIQWCRDQGLMKTAPKCEICGEAMKEKSAIWRCCKRGYNPHDVKYSIFKNSFFTNIKLKVEQVRLQYLFP